MTEAKQAETARQAFTYVTGSLADGTIVAVEGQASPSLVATRQSCDRLIALLEARLARLQRLRRRSG